MGKYDDIKAEINTLCEEGEALAEALKKDVNGIPKDYKYFHNNYEDWYSRCLMIVTKFLPEREKDFIQLYKNENRKELNYSTYTISDAMRGIGSRAMHYSVCSACYNIFQQKSILHSVLGCMESKIANIQTILQADVFVSEIEVAKHLVKNGFYRAAGAICGVIIEKHLATICEKREITIKKKRPTISDLNETLKDAAYDNIQWRKIQCCADIRNLCDHDGEREPTKTDLEELIAGTEQIIKNVT